MVCISLHMKKWEPETEDRTGIPPDPSIQVPVPTLYIIATA
ncbi:hypothetical protein BACCOPRO_01939 [Phocaeicola coprophilus DSM 18228 = JCM 13818]|uniref:Uncharacterized protein n=1 Tax=Phocaeicola coprophilus DSM 18228 = JCM 13818 TaxID=547042 RepID=S0F7U7_9BACT|nr:hypothetical protein BACCOPRO_01939 [Phocaeicola coprophilus DSM 18228 = JCM 13818]